MHVGAEVGRCCVSPAPTAGYGERFLSPPSPGCQRILCLNPWNRGKN